MTNFAFDLGQVIYFMRDNRIHSASVLARMIVENAHDDWTCTNEQVKLFTPFGKNNEIYGTCHGLTSAEDAFGSKEALIRALLEEEN